MDRPLNFMCQETDAHVAALVEGRMRRLIADAGDEVRRLSRIEIPRLKRALEGARAQSLRRRVHELSADLQSARHELMALRQMVKLGALSFEDIKGREVA